ncbi:hypothetical protein [Paraburkholderia oxyphila]|uniref:hypothetical protein n=1 Tax=Paraburkholderia oxyphila TaxID=614212 RepID=UPI00048016B9|nr:hypothetical protein [Paraburkholderia oxyphila]
MIAFDGVKNTRRSSRTRQCLGVQIDRDAIDIRAHRHLAAPLFDHATPAISITARCQRGSFDKTALDEQLQGCRVQRPQRARFASDWVQMSEAGLSVVRPAQG